VNVVAYYLGDGVLLECSVCGPLSVERDRTTVKASVVEHCEGHTVPTQGRNGER